MTMPEHSIIFKYGVPDVIMYGFRAYTFSYRKLAKPYGCSYMGGYCADLSDDTVMYQCPDTFITFYNKEEPDVPIKYRLAPKKYVNSTLYYCPIILSIEYESDNDDPSP
jgi:hypothetical protein